MKIKTYEKYILKAYSEVPLPQRLIDSELYFFYAGYVDKLLSNNKYSLESEVLFDKEYLKIFNKNVNKLNDDKKKEVLEFYYLLKIVFNILKKYSE